MPKRGKKNDERKGGKTAKGVRPALGTIKYFEVVVFEG